MSPFVGFCITFFFRFVLSAIDADLITSLPGYPGGALPQRHWSGYISVPVSTGVTAYVHYWLVENSAKDPNAPLTVWYNGGPGGSALMGLFTIMGPLTLNDYSFTTPAYNQTGIPTVYDNPYSWHTAPTNYLFVEHPAPVGFSYCDGVCNWDDTNQAVANYNFLVNFFQAYPELAKNEFYITGESYAGIFIPTVALEILSHRNSSNLNLAPWSLKGFGIGNGCAGNRVYTCTPYSGWVGTQVAVDFRYGHGMISEEKYQQIYEACDGHWGTYEAPPEPCASLLEDPSNPVMSETGDTDQMGGGYFLYDTCSNDMVSIGKDGLPVVATPHTPSLPLRATSDAEYPYNSGEYACGQENAVLIYLNLPQVQSAIHVKLVNKTSWDFFTNLNYNMTIDSLLSNYSNQLIPAYRILQWSGDADPCVPYVGTYRWIESLNLPVQDQWHPWQAPDTMPVTGYTKRYKTAYNFTFATVRDAGHMAARYKPKQLLYLFEHFLHNQPL